MALTIGKHVRGHTLHTPAVKTNFPDPECVRLLQNGAPIIGVAEATGLGKPDIFPTGVDEAEIEASIEERNAKLLKTIREDPHATFLVEGMWKDAEKGRMSKPVRPREQSAGAQILSGAGAQA